MIKVGIKGELLLDESTKKLINNIIQNYFAINKHTVGIHFINYNKNQIIVGYFHIDNEKEYFNVEKILDTFKREGNTINNVKRASNEEEYQKILESIDTSKLSIKELIILKNKIKPL